MMTIITTANAGIIALFGEKVLGWLGIHIPKEDFHHNGDDNDI